MTLHIPGKRAPRRHTPSTKRVRKAFDRDALAMICEAREESFPDAFGLDRYQVVQKDPADWYAFRDNGASVLAVAHLDTVVKHSQRTCRFLDTDGGPVVYSGALDDRLGAFIILDLLPKLGLNHDWLLTTGEEQGQSTAAFFEPPKEYDWVIEFDRGGTDVVMYQYDDEDTAQLVWESGATVGQGSFSDIAWLDHLGVKCFNWGVGYRDYHSTRSHAYLDDTYAMVARYLRFHAANAGTVLPHLGPELLTADEDLWADTAHGPDEYWAYWDQGKDYRW